MHATWLLDIIASVCFNIYFVVFKLWFWLRRITCLLLIYAVTMLAQRTAPPDMQCKDKFLVQGTVIPAGTSEEDITPDLVRIIVVSCFTGLVLRFCCAKQFAKGSGKHIEEKKLKVFLVSATPPPVLLPINGELKLDPNLETSLPKDRMQTGVENIPPPLKVSNRAPFMCYVFLLF